LHQDIQEHSARIAFVVDNNRFGGNERTVLQMVRDLPRRRYETGVACLPGGVFVDRLHDLGIPVIATEAPDTGSMGTGFRLAREFRRFRPDIVHTMGEGALAGRIAARLARTPVIVSGGDPIGGDEATAGRLSWQRIVEQATSRFVDRFVVSNRKAVSALAERYRVSASRVAVIPGGVDIERYDPSRSRTGAWRTQLGIPSRAIVVGSIGRLVARKGFRELIRAFASIEKRDVWLVIGGDGEGWEELHGLVEAFDLKDRVRFTGFVDAVPELLADLDIFVLPSLNESHPTVLLEAMAMARPVVASDIAAASDVITDGVEGKLATAGDVPALAEAIGLFLGDATVARRCGRNARRKVEQEYTVDRMVRRSALLYEELLSGDR